MWDDLGPLFFNAIESLNSLCSKVHVLYLIHREFICTVNAILEDGTRVVGGEWWSTGSIFMGLIQF